MNKRKNCPICNSSSSKTILSINFEESVMCNFLDEYYNENIDWNYLENQKYLLLSCRKCDFYWQQNILESEGMKELYENWIDIEESFNKRTGWKFFRDNLSLVSNVDTVFSQQPKTLKYLDYGMGWGYMAMAAQAFGLQSYGFELSEKRRKHAEKHGIEVFNDWNQIEDMTFDFINLKAVLEHHPEPYNLLGKLRKILSEDGLIFIAVPNSNQVASISPQTVCQKGPYQPLEHINSFTRNSLQKIANQHNLSETHPYPTLKHSILKSIVKKILTTFQIEPYLNWRVTSCFFEPN